MKNCCFTNQQEKWAQMSSSPQQSVWCDSKYSRINTPWAAASTGFGKHLSWDLGGWRFFQGMPVYCFCNGKNYGWSQNLCFLFVCFCLAHCLAMSSYQQGNPTGIMNKSLKTLAQRSQADQHPTSPDISCAAFASPSANKKMKHNFQEMGTIKEKVFLVFQSVREGCLLELYLIYN